MVVRWIREFVKGYEGYRRDSVVSEEVNKDLVGKVIEIGEREVRGEGFKGLGRGVEKLLGGF